MNIISIPFEIINLDNRQNVHPVISACMGDKPVRMIVDTGASHSCLSKKILKQFVGKMNMKADIVVGIGRGRLKNKLVQVPDFKIGELSIHDYSFLGLQLAHVNKMLACLDIEPIDGLLGSDILYAYRAIIDYNKLTIFFHKSEEVVEG
jgi:hypothetical protein